MSYTFTSELWIYPSQAASWYFINVPRDISEKIKVKQKGKPPVAWGSIRVKACVGQVSWETSIFPNKDSGGYILPIKKHIRDVLSLDAGDDVKVKIDIAGSSI